MTYKKIKKINCSGKEKSAFRNLDIFQYQHNSESIDSGRNSTSTFDLIGKYYSQVPAAAIPRLQIADIDCFAVDLAKFLIDKISNKLTLLRSDNSFSDEFYNSCIDEVKSVDLYSEVNDPELMVIYIKQMINLLRRCGVLENRSGIAEIKSSVLKRSLFGILFNTFWNEIDWSDIFPSDPDAAEDLKKNRFFMRDILLSCSAREKLDTVTNEFYELTGFGKKNDVFMTSFIDFYLFTWLKHFGIIKYIAGSCNSPVYIMLTDRGRQILSCAG